MARGIESRLGRLDPGEVPLPAQRVSVEFANRLEQTGPSRLNETLGALVLNLHRLIEDLRQRDADMDGDVRSLLRQLES